MPWDTRATPERRHAALRMRTIRTPSEIEKTSGSVGLIAGRVQQATVRKTAARQAPVVGMGGAGSSPPPRIIRKTTYAN